MGSTTRAQEINLLPITHESSQIRESSDDQIDGQTDSPCVLQDFLSFKAAAQKPESGLKTFLMSLLSKGVNPRVTVRNDITSFSRIPLSSANQ